MSASPLDVHNLWLYILSEQSPISRALKICPTTVASHPMDFDPSVNSKMLNQTEAGELIRLRWGGPSLALVAFRDSTRVLIFLAGPAMGNGPSYLVPEADTKVVSYGRDYIVEIDQDEKFIDMRETSYYDVPGAIAVTSTQRFMCAAPVPSTHTYGTIRYEWETGQIVATQSALNGVYFGKWKLWLPQSTHLQHQTHTPVFSLALGPVKGTS